MGRHGINQDSFRSILLNILPIFLVSRHHGLEEGCGTLERGVKDPGDEGQRRGGSTQD